MSKKQASPSKTGFPAEALYQHSDVPDPIRDNAVILKEAAVLIPLIRENGNWSVLFIRRAENERDRHSGQVAFPGGRRDKQDSSIVDTALRELHEEIGIDRQGIAILGQLPLYLTISDFQITPVVATVPWPSQITMQTEEVARVFAIPLDWLRNTDNLEIRPRNDLHQANQQPYDPSATGQQRTRLSANLKKRQGHPVVYYNKYDNELLWGATARMTLNLGQAIEQGTIKLPN